MEPLCFVPNHPTRGSNRFHNSNSCINRINDTVVCAFKNWNAHISCIKYRLTHSFECNNKIDARSRVPLFWEALYWCTSATIEKKIRSTSADRHECFFFSLYCCTSASIEVPLKIMALETMCINLIVAREWVCQPIWHT